MQIVWMEEGKEKYRCAFQTGPQSMKAEIIHTNIENVNRNICS